MKAKQPLATRTEQFKFEKATRYYAAVTGKEEQYQERTRRNSFWVGGELGQRKIKNMKIAVAGLGGMGSNIAEALVRLGVGHLRIADPDIIERSNINRQVIANENTLKKSKADASADELRTIATDCELVVYNQGVQEDIVEEFVAGCDAVVDEIDVYPLDRHIILHRAARKRGIPLYSAYAVGMGIHFYKFEGESYTFENFVTSPSAEWTRPKVEDIMEMFAPPLPHYLDPAAMERLSDELKNSGAPIFGPSTLLGHSLVTTRLIVDLLRLENESRTPVMPEYLALDAREMTFQKAKVPTIR